MDLLSSGTCTYQLCMYRHSGRQKVVEGMMEKLHLPGFIYKIFALWLSHLLGTGQSRSLQWDRHPYPGSYAGWRTSRSEMWIRRSWILYWCIFLSLELRVFSVSTQQQWEVSLGASCAVAAAPSTSHIPRSSCPRALVAFSDFWILQVDKHQNLGVYITKWEWGSCLSDSSSPQVPICWCGERGRSRLVAAAPTLECWDPKGAGMAPGREETTQPKRRPVLSQRIKTSI